MKATFKIWLNGYKNSKLISSRPFKNMEEAECEKERMEKLIKGCGFNHKYKIEEEGNMDLYIYDEWLAISSNYDKYRNDYLIRHYLYETYGVNIKKWEGFAERYYKNPQKYNLKILISVIQK